jgi:flagellar basal-body rod modification protein FlgD
MAAAVAGIWNSLSTVHNAATTKPAETANGSDSSDGGSSSISANDFLTLLVTEMKNQDPTANTDPNEYINQLVQVNSLEQLISINQTLTADSAGAASNDAATKSGLQPSVMNSANPATSLHANAANHLADSAAAGRVSGNLTIPGTSSAAIRVAQSLANN